jgi:hypothetical protein
MRFIVPEGRDDLCHDLVELLSLAVTEAGKGARRLFNLVESLGVSDDDGGRRDYWDDRFLVTWRRDPGGDEQQWFNNAWEWVARARGKDPHDAVDPGVGHVVMIPPQPPPKARPRR